MNRIRSGFIAVVLTTACGGSAPPAASPSPAAPPAPLPPPVEVAAPVAPPPREPTPEEKKAAEEKAKLEADWAKMLSDHQVEAVRLTPELVQQARSVAEKAHASGRKAIEAAVRGTHRKPGNGERDAARRPAEMLELFGFTPASTVLEYGPGEGWYTELLAPALARSGKLLVTTADPDGPKTERATLYAERTRLFIRRAPALYGKIQPVVVDPRAPDLKLEGTVDLALVFRGMHGMVNSGTLLVWLAEIHAALKPKGFLGVEQHRAPPDAVPVESAKKGYLPEKWVIEQVEAAGFQLVTKSEMNANPRDTKDHPEGVWTLPPTLRLGDTDRQKYVAIGESDRMTLKFVKTASKVK